MSVWTAVTLIAAFLAKIPALFVPLTGYFGSYQVTNAMMAEMMFIGGPLSVLTPRTFLIMGDAPGMHLLYYPFASLAAACAKSVLGGTIPFWGKMQAAMAAFAAGYFWIRCIRDYYTSYGPASRNETSAAMFLNFSPMLMIAGVSFQNEAIALFFLTFSFYVLHKYKGTTAALSAGLLFSLAVTARLHFILAGPAFLYAIWNRKGKYRGSRLAVFSIASASIFIAWVAWTYVLETRFPGRTATSFFSQSGEGRVLITSLLASPDFYLSVGKILAGQFMTPLGLLLLIAGFLPGAKNLRVFRIWLACALLAILLLPRKVIDHPFYLLGALPPAAVFAGRGLQMIRLRFPVLVTPVVVLFFLLAARYYMPPAFSAAGGEGIPSAGQAVAKIAGAEDRIVAAHGTSNDLLYYSGRTGWTFDVKMAQHPLSDQPRHSVMKKDGYGDPARWLEHLRGQGARYFAVADVEAFRGETSFYEYVAGGYPAVAADAPGLLVYDLGEKS